MRQPSPDGPHAPLIAPNGVAIFLCRCRGVVAGKLDMEVLRDELSSSPEVRTVDVLEDCCSAEDMDRMRLSLMSGEVDRFIVAGCSFKTSHDRFMYLAKDAGLDPSMVELCNIKEQCALVHPKKEATDKARIMIRASLRRSTMLQPVPSRRLEEVDKGIAIIGNGHSAVVAVREAIGLGHHVTVICPCDELVDDAHGEETITLEETGFERFRKQAGGALTITTSSVVTGISGVPGSFALAISTPLGETTVNAGAVIVAMDEAPVENPLRKMLMGDVIDQHQLETMLRSGMRPEGTVVMLAMDLSGESAFDPMSTHEAVHNALYLKSMSPRTQVMIITREVFALGQCEHGYRRAQEAGAVVIRTDKFPDIGKEGAITIKDLNLGHSITLRYDTIVIDSSTEIPDLQELASIIGIPLDARGRFRRPIAKLKPSSSLREGVFLCGTATERNLGIGPGLEARSSVVMASAMLQEEMVDDGDKAEVWPEKCSGCLTCVRLCPYSAPSIDQEGRALIDVSRCQGCGICVSACPSKALQMSSFRDDQIEEQIKASLGGLR